MARVRRRNLPQMMRLMQRRVQQRVVLKPMNPVNQAVRKEQECRKRKDKVRPASGVVLDPVVQLRLAPNLAQEPRNRVDGHERHALHRQPDFLRYLTENGSPKSRA